MDNTITEIQQDAVKLVSDVDAAIAKAEAWAQKVLGGSLETRVLGGFATEVLNALKSMKTEFDAIAQRLGDTALVTPSTAEPQPPQ